MAESPKSAAPAAAVAPAPAAPAYTPSGAAASERMLSSVIGRVVGPFGTPIGRSLHFADRLVGGIVDGAGPVSGRAPAQRLYAQPVFGTSDAHAPAERPLTTEPKNPAGKRERISPTQDLLTASPLPKRSNDLKLPRSLRPTMALSSPERMFGKKSASDSRAADTTDGDSGRPTQTILATGWEPPVAHTALELGKNPESPSPLWGALPRPTLDPLVAAVAADVNKAEAAERERPAMELLRSGAPEPPRNAAPKGPISAITEEQAHRMAVESSKRLMEAVRAHAIAHSGSDDRISLGDMALISFADSTKQMAAAESYTSTAPGPQPAAKALGQLPNPKIKENQADLHNKLQAMAKLVAQDLKQVEALSKERFGAHG